MEDFTHLFTWIFWYIWKAEIDSLFKGLELSPKDTLVVIYGRLRLGLQLNGHEE